MVLVLVLMLIFVLVLVLELALTLALVLVSGHRRANAWARSANQILGRQSNNEMQYLPPIILCVFQ